MTEPTDAELIAELEAAGVVFMAFRGGLSGTKELWTTSGSQDAKKIAAGMRAAIAKWGQPAVAGEPVAWRYVPSKVWGEFVYTEDPKRAQHARDNGIDVQPVFTTPQPTQAQAGAVPLTDEQKHARNPYRHSRGAASVWMAGFEAAELWYRIGIKGGQHD